MSRNKSLVFPEKKIKEHFAVSSTEEVKAAKQAVVLNNTKKGTGWAVNMSAPGWSREMNGFPGNVCSEDILLNSDQDLLCKWLCVFATEMRKEDGAKYTPWSMSQLFAGLECWPNEPNF